MSDTERIPLRRGVRPAGVGVLEWRTYLAHAQDAYVVGDGFPCFCRTCQQVARDAQGSVPAGGDRS